MAKKKSGNSRSRSGPKKSIFSPVLCILVVVIAVGGYSMLGIPLIGPLAKTLRSTVNDWAAKSHADNEANATQSLEGIDRQSWSLGFGVNRGVPAQLAATRRPVDKLLIASFNIQVLGKSKLAKTDVMPIIVQTIRQFDIVAIQEIRAKEDDVLPRLVAMLNSDGSRYDFLIGPRLGRSVSTEQYAFVFDSQRVEYDPTSVGTIGDPGDGLHREPFVARFRPRTSRPDRAFTFWLVNAHTDPDEVPEEIKALADVFQVMQAARSDEDDVILLGDLNASEKQMGEFDNIPGIHWVVRSGVKTNTRQTKAYDNIIFQHPRTSEFTGRWGVFDFGSIFELSREQALRVSDHLPVWAEFQISESPADGRFAKSPVDSRPWRWK